MASRVRGSAGRGRDDSGRRPTGRLAAVLALGAAGALLAAGCGSGLSAAAREHNSAYLSEVHDSAPEIGSFRTDTELVRLGHAACDGFASGASYVELADRLALAEGSKPLPSEDLGAVITAAADSYCPKFRSKVS